MPNRLIYIATINDIGVRFYSTGDAKEPVSPGMSSLLTAFGCEVEDASNLMELIEAEFPDCVIARRGPFSESIIPKRVAFALLSATSPKKVGEEVWFMERFAQEYEVAEEIEGLMTHFEAPTNIS